MAPRAAPLQAKIELVVSCNSHESKYQSRPNESFEDKIYLEKGTFTKYFLQVCGESAKDYQYPLLSNFP